MTQPQMIPWRGSVTDLATDCAYVLTRAQGHELVAELTRFLTLSHLREKFQGKTIKDR